MTGLPQLRVTIDRHAVARTAFVADGCPFRGALLEASVGREELPGVVLTLLMGETSPQSPQSRNRVTLGL